MFSKTLKTTAATLAVIAGGSLAASAESHSGKMGDMIAIDQIEDGAIYRLVAEDDSFAQGNSYTEINPEWERVGEIEDVLINQQGQVVGLLAEIGGFLDIGDRDVIIPLENVRFAMGEGDNPTYNFVTNLTEDQLSQLEETDEDMWD